MWKHAAVSLPAQSKPFHVTIEGMRGTGYQGDIAVDDISLQSGACPGNHDNMNILLNKKGRAKYYNTGHIQ
jgi:hypothetical protein